MTEYHSPDPNSDVARLRDWLEWWHAQGRPMRPSAEVVERYEARRVLHNQRELKRYHARKLGLDK